jgi:quercetin dioxygenase-like cupin family protein
LKNSSYHLIEKTNKIWVEDTNSIPWEERINEKTGLKMLGKKLHSDLDTGMMINYYYYPAGVVTPWHVHNCAHGMYVLEGTLYTHDGSYGPGSFVWFPEGTVAEHGAIADGGVTVLFITNKEFNITYLGKE